MNVSCPRCETVFRVDPAKVPGVAYFMPIGKSPHGMDVDPSGKWVVAGGKLQPSTTVFNFEKIAAAVQLQTFEGEVRGVPILKDGQCLGAVGVSGVKSSEDAQIARAGLAAIGL